jgi:hypothetical protein
VTDRALSVFINCPFDTEFKPCFEALIFTVLASGYRVRCALEDSNSGDIRFDKLCRLIEACDKSIHDLSRVELNPSGLPRFNMPFEFGLFLGAHRFGGKRHKSKTALAMVAAPYKLPIYLSDIAGNDPAAHGDDPTEVIRIVRKFLHVRPDGNQLPGAAHIRDTFAQFKSELPNLAAALNIAEDEIDPFRDYRDFIAILQAFLLAS